MFRNINAVVLFVQDFDTALTFYRDALGLEVVVLEPTFAAFKMHEQDFAINAITEGAAMIGVDLSAFESETGRLDRVLLCATVEDVDALYAQYTANGVTFTGAPVDKPWGYRVAYFRDPEGNIWELRQPIEVQAQG